MRLKKIDALSPPQVASDRPQENQARHRFRRTALGVLGFLALVGLFYGWWQSRYVSTTGRVMVHEVRVSAVTRGRIDSLEVEEGDRVEAGEVLVRLASEERQAEVKRAQAFVDEARSHLDALEDTGVDPRIIAELELAERERARSQQHLRRAEAELEEEEKLLARARQSAERADRIFLLKAATRSEWETARAELDAAEAAMASARARVAEEQAAVTAALGVVEAARQALAFARRERADELESRRQAVVQAEGRLEQARARLAEMSLRAPRDGVVSWIGRRVGEAVDEDDVILNVMVPERAWVLAYVSADELTSIRDGLSALVRIDGFEPERYEARVFLIHDSERSAERLVRVGPERARSPRRLADLLYPVRVVFEEDPPPGLWPEMIATVRIRKKS